MTGVFINGPIGSAGATAIYHLAGWCWLCVFGALAAVALLLQVNAGRPDAARTAA